MPFPSPLDSTAKALIRGIEYEAHASLAYVPQIIVWQAEVLTPIPSGVFASIAWDNETVGGYADIQVGQTLYISSTTDLRSPIAVGRIRLAADATTLYIGEMAVVLEAGDVLTVVDDYWLHEKLGRIANDGSVYVDWDVTFQKPAPLINGLQSGYVNDAASGDASFSFTPTATAMAYGATITDWLWDVADGTLTGGGVDTDQDIAVDFPQGFRWVRLTVTDSNGVSNFMVFPVWVGTTYIIPNIETPSITAAVNEGYNATFQTWDYQGTNILRSLLDNTYVVLYSSERYGTTTTPILTNVDFVGRLRQENSSTRGDATLSIVQAGSFQVEGFGAALNRLSAPQLSIAHDTTPTTWGQINRPTPPRMIAHLCTYYNTLSNLVSLTFGTDDNDFVAQAVSMTETSAGAACIWVAAFINAQVNYAPSGEITVQRQAIYLDDAGKNALDTIMNFTTTDLLSFDIDRDYVPSVGRVFAGAERFSTTTLTTDIFTSSAPPTARGNGEGTAQQDGQILTADSTDADAIAELNVRTSALYAASQPAAKLDVLLWDGWRNILVPTCYQWWTFTLASTDNQRGLVYTSSQRWLLQGYNHEIDIATGTRVLRATFVAEPVTGDAQVQSAIVPDLIPPYLPVLDVLPPYPGFPPNPLINYPTDTPAAIEKQMKPSGAYAGYSPLPPDQAQAAADAYALPGCEARNIFFSNPSNVSTSMTLVNGDTYILTIKGDAQISTNGWAEDIDFTGGSMPSGWTVAVGTHVPGSGIEGVPPPGPQWVAVSRVHFTPGTPFICTRFVVQTSGFEAGSFGQIISPTTTEDSYYFNPNLDPEPTSGNDISGTGLPATFSALQFLAGIAWQTSYLGRYLTGLHIEGTGFNPFSGAAGFAIRGDAFYHSYNDEAGGLPQAYGTSQGLYLNNGAVGTIPEYSANHEYVVLYEGEGNPLPLRYEAPDYSDIQNVPLRILICPIE